LAENEDRLALVPRLLELLLGRAQAARLPCPVSRPDEEQEDVGGGDLVEERSLRTGCGRAGHLGHHGAVAELLDAGPRAGAHVLEAALDRADEDAGHRRTS
jgi:hypothetical protein